LPWRDAATAGLGPRDPKAEVETHQNVTDRNNQVFKVLWSEPQGQKGLDIKNKYTEKYQVDNAWGERFYVGFRRFIIVANDEGHCTCVYVPTATGILLYFT
jgi:hypothetical protein